MGGHEQRSKGKGKVLFEVALMSSIVVWAIQLPIKGFNGDALMLIYITGIPGWFRCLVERLSKCFVFSLSALLSLLSSPMLTPKHGEHVTSKVSPLEVKLHTYISLVPLTHLPIHSAACPKPIPFLLPLSSASRARPTAGMSPSMVICPRSVHTRPPRTTA